MTLSFIERLRDSAPHPSRGRLHKSGEPGKPFVYGIGGHLVGWSYHPRSILFRCVFLEELRGRRLAEAREILEELKTRDPGGDVVL